MGDSPQNDDQPKKVVLIVEDDEQISRMLGRKLSTSNFSILTAKDGEEGFALALQHKPDMIILDILMPRMNGMDTLKKLREKNEWGAHVPVILLTNVTPTDEDINTNIAELSPTYYMMKMGIDLNDLVAKIHARLESPNQIA